MDKRMVIAGYARDRDCEELGGRLKLLVSIESDHG